MYSQIASIYAIIRSIHYRYTGIQQLLRCSLIILPHAVILNTIKLTWMHFMWSVLLYSIVYWPISTTWPITGIHTSQIWSHNTCTRLWGILQKILVCDVIMQSVFCWNCLCGASVAIVVYIVIYFLFKTNNF